MREKVYPISSSKDRRFVIQSFPVIPLLLPVPYRTENKHDHGHHHQKSDAKERVEQDIHHGDPPRPAWGHECSPTGFQPPHRDSTSLYPNLPPPGRSYPLYCRTRYIRFFLIATRNAASLFRRRSSSVSRRS